MLEVVVARGKFLSPLGTIARPQLHALHLKRPEGPKPQEGDTATRVRWVRQGPNSFSATEWPRFTRPFKRAGKRGHAPQLPRDDPAA